MFGLVLLSAIWTCLTKLQRHICRVVGPDLSASLQSLAHRRNVASFSLFNIDTIFIGVQMSLLNLVPLPHPTRYSNRLS